MTALRRLAFIFLSTAFGLLTASCANGSTRLAAQPAPARPAVHQVVLVVGDSLVAQASADLRAATNSGVEVRVSAQLGSAPCDWYGRRFEAALAADRPTVVIFAFTGNAGSAPNCVNSAMAYPLAELLANYRANLVAMADRAENIGAQVVYSAPPARNPLVPAPPPIPTATSLRNGPTKFYGFQGVSQLRSFYANLARTAGRHWRFSDAAAQAVSPGFVYTRTLPCTDADGPCSSGYVDVRDVPTDAIHLDRDGHGARRFAEALLSDALLSEALPADIQARENYG
jgi:hypothetical protein